jgi:hypothetical protein
MPLPPDHGNVGRLRCGILILALVRASLAHAAPVDETAAKARFAAGTAYFRDHHYREAIEEFLAASRASPAVDLLYNIALCYVELDDPGRATGYFERYLAARPDSAERESISVDLVRFAPRVARIVVRAPPGTEVLVDGIAAEVAPPDPLPVTAGRHRIEGRLEGQAPSVVTLDLPAGATREIDLASSKLPLVGAPPSAAEPVPPRRRWLVPVVVVIAAAVVVAGVVTGVYFVGRPDDLRSDGEARCAGRSGCIFLNAAESFR